MLSIPARPVVMTIFLLSLFMPVIAESSYHVAVDGNDSTGSGSTGAPWATITKALDSVPDSSVILVHSGTYNGRVRIRGTFTQGVVVRAETTCQARLRHTGSVVTSYDNAAIIANPQLTPPTGVVLPRWDQSSNLFGDGSAKISAVFTNLVSRYCALANNSPAVNTAYEIQTPATDILGNPRPTGGGSDIGACEFGPPTANGGRTTVAPLINLLLRDE